MAPHDLSQNRSFEAWSKGFRERAEQSGIDGWLLNHCWPQIRLEPGVLEKHSAQAEFTLTICEYLARVVTEKRIKTGRAKFRKYRSALSRISDSYRVDAEVILAIWGVETNYGSTRGDWPVLSALATLAHTSHRAEFFENELLTALTILEQGDATPAELVGSWAGAMGHGQFMPSSFQEFAVDFDGDGRRDIWRIDPRDGLASIANYLRAKGWRMGAPWGVDVHLPDNFDYRLAGHETRRSADEWSDLGVTAADGSRLADYGPGSVLIPSGAMGPAFMAYNNFDVLLTYNRADAYAIGVGHLADRLSGGRALSVQCPDDLAMLTRDEMQELQEKLTAQGFDTLGADGFTGPNTQSALRAYQASRGLAPDGVATGAVLQAIRTET